METEPYMQSDCVCSSRCLTSEGEDAAVCVHTTTGHTPIVNVGVCPFNAKILLAGM